MTPLVSRVGFGTLSAHACWGRQHKTCPVTGRLRLPRVRGLQSLRQRAGLPAQSAERLIELVQFLLHGTRQILAIFNEQMHHILAE
jgi:hypothetical protein